MRSRASAGGRNLREEWDGQYAPYEDEPPIPAHMIGTVAARSNSLPRAPSNMRRPGRNYFAIRIVDHSGI